MENLNLLSVTVFIIFLTITIKIGFEILNDYSLRKLKAVFYSKLNEHRHIPNRNRISLFQLYKKENFMIALIAIRPSPSAFSIHLHFYTFVYDHPIVRTYEKIGLIVPMSFYYHLVKSIENDESITFVKRMKNYEAPTPPENLVDFLNWLNAKKSNLIMDISELYDSKNSSETLLRDLEEAEDIRDLYDLEDIFKNRN